MNKNIVTVGIDLAKNIFQIYGINAAGENCLNKRVTRKRFIMEIEKLPKEVLIGIEACGGSHYWARFFKSLGYKVKMMSPQYVKAYVIGNKNDLNDAKAICEAATRNHIKSIAIKSIQQQEVLSIHKIREKVVQQSTQLKNELRGILMEYGLVCNKGWASLNIAVVKILQDRSNGFSDFFRDELSRLFERIQMLREEKLRLDKVILTFANQDPDSKRLMHIPGLGPITASALKAAVGDAKQFKCGRDLAAYLGLTPRQYASANKNMLLGISKKGNRYLRYLLVHGARSAVAASKGKKDSLSRWIQSLVKRRGINKAVVALANKNARICWALLANNCVYQPDLVCGPISKG